MALAPDISGVCSTEDTLETTSKPTNTASTKNVSSVVPSAHQASFRVTQAAATISSSKSGTTWPSVVISSSRLTTLRA